MRKKLEVIKKIAELKKERADLVEKMVSININETYRHWIHMIDSKIDMLNWILWNQDDLSS